VAQPIKLDPAERFSPTAARREAEPRAMQGMWLGIDWD
jgi:hypothetical protein